MPRKRPIHQIFEDNVRRLLAEQGMSLLELSEVAGVSRSQLYDYFSGDKDATLGWLQQVADGLGVEVVDLLVERKRRKR